MMKRLSLRGLRISSQPREVECVVEGRERGGGGGDGSILPSESEIMEGENNPNLHKESRQDSSSDIQIQEENNTAMTITSATQEEQKSVSKWVKKREKGGFFKNLKRRLTGNFRGKRDSASGEVMVIDDENSSENRDDGSLHCTKVLHSSRKSRHLSFREDGCAKKETRQSQIETNLEGKGYSKMTLSTQKEHVSKSEESSTPTEEEKVQTVFLTDAEYGHTSAPFSVTNRGSPVPSSTVAGSHSSNSEYHNPSADKTKIIDDQNNQTLLVSDSHGLEGESSSHDVGKNASSDNNKGAYALSMLPQCDESDTPPSEPPPPPPMTLSSNLPLNNQIEETSAEIEQTPHSNHLELLRGGLNDYYSYVYDQLKEPPKSWSLTKELFKLSKYGWYWGPITRVEAEEKLVNQADGAFLVRDSSDERYLLSLSFRSHGRTLHTRIEHCNGEFSFYAQPESEGYFSIVDLIAHSMNDSQTGVFCYSRARTPGSPSFPVRLTKPVSRFTQVRSLQYLCRFVIRQYTRLDHIQKLPLPSRIRGWLEENQY